MISSPETIDTLNRVLSLLARSFPQYMRYARPYIPPGREEAMRTIQTIVAEQDALAERVTQFIFDAGGRPDPGDFPIEYTDTHDLAIDFLVSEAIDCQQQDVADLQQCVDSLRLAPLAEPLSVEAHAMAKRHLESLRQVSPRRINSTKLSAAPAFANDIPVAKQASGTPHRQEERKLLAGDPNSPG